MSGAAVETTSFARIVGYQTILTALLLSVFAVGVHLLERLDANTSINLPVEATWFSVLLPFIGASAGFITGWGAASYRPRGSIGGKLLYLTAGGIVSGAVALGFLFAGDAFADRLFPTPYVSAPNPFINNPAPLFGILIILSYLLMICILIITPIHEAARKSIFW